MRWPPRPEWWSSTAGGRPSTTSRASRPASSSPQLDPPRYEVVPGRHHPRRVAGSTPARLVAGIADGDGTLPSPDLAPAGDRREVGALLEAGDGRETVVFPLLHGTMGEDGTVQGLLEVLPASLRGGRGAGLGAVHGQGGGQGGPRPPRRPPGPLAEPAGSTWSTPAFLESAGADLGYPIFVKPANLGSSIGISRVTDRAGFGGGGRPGRDLRRRRRLRGRRRRPGDRGGGARQRRARGPRCPARSSRPRASTTTRTST